jgi:hypothetical protein
LVRARISLTGFRFLASLNPVHIKFHYSEKKKKKKKKKKIKKKKEKKKNKDSKKEKKKVNFDYFILILHHLTNTHTTPDSKRTPQPQNSD